jgi:hypothetical protein
MILCTSIWEFKTQMGYWPSWPRFFMITFSLLRQMSWHYLKVAIAYSFQILTHLRFLLNLSPHSMLCNPCSWNNNLMTSELSLKCHLHERFYWNFVDALNFDFNFFGTKHLYFLWQMAYYFNPISRIRVAGWSVCPNWQTCWVHDINRISTGTFMYFLSLMLI